MHIAPKHLLSAHTQLAYFLSISPEDIWADGVFYFIL